MTTQITIHKILAPKRVNFRNWNGIFNLLNKKLIIIKINNHLKQFKYEKYILDILYKKYLFNDTKYIEEYIYDTSTYKLLCFKVHLNTLQQ